MVYNCSVTIQKKQSYKLFYHFIMLTSYAFKRCTYFLISFTATVTIIILNADSFFMSRSSPKIKFLGTEPNLRIGNARFDNSREIRADYSALLRIYEWVWTGEDWDSLTNYFNVCIATQASFDRIGTIHEVATHWQGPISLAVFISQPTEWIVLQEFVAYLQKCSDPFRKNVAIHLAVPSSFSFPEKRKNDVSSSSITCKNLQKNIDILISKFVSHKGKVNVYPQNHMRNIARKTCNTAWVLSTDVDIIPSYQSAVLLQDFYNTSEAKLCKKCAFVIPTFEIKESAIFPTSKRKLLNYTRKGLARQFHEKYFDLGHKSTNYTQWSTTNLDDGPVKISHAAYSQENNFYEPFYISSDSINPFDERFIGYGFVRSSQATEAKMRGWNFKVLTPVFLIQRGLKERISTTESPNRRSLQTARNSKIFKDFLKELKILTNHGLIKVNTLSDRSIHW